MPASQLERRGLVTRWDDDGMLVVSGRLTLEEGELLLSALEAVDESSAEDSSTGGEAPERADQRRADGGRTDLDNLITLCCLHHRRLHEGAFTLAAGGDDGFVFRAPSGDRIVAAPASQRAAGPPPRSRSLMPQPAPGRLSLDAALAAPASRAA